MTNGSCSGILIADVVDASTMTWRVKSEESMLKDYQIHPNPIMGSFSISLRRCKHVIRRSHRKPSTASKVVEMIQSAWSVSKVGSVDASCSLLRELVDDTEVVRHRRNSSALPLCLMWPRTFHTVQTV